MHQLIIVILCLLLYLAPFALLAGTATPQLMLAHTADLNALPSAIEHYWLSEKYDGVRAFWNGQYLQTRYGNKIHAPDWFTKDFPSQALDGELWIARGQFELTSSIVRKHQAVDSEWRQIKYMVFDLPNSSHPFEQRQLQLNNLIDGSNITWLMAVEHKRVTSTELLLTEFNNLVTSGGEGLMLNLGQQTYTKSRTTNLLKLKPYYDAEAIVIEHIPGKGKYTGMMGSLLVENNQGYRFKVGSGFSDNERQQPPAIGDVITYKYSGYTKNGLPRFASFIRVRHD